MKITETKTPSLDLHGYHFIASTSGPAAWRGPRAPRFGKAGVLVQALPLYVSSPWQGVLGTRPSCGAHRYPAPPPGLRQGRRVRSAGARCVRSAAAGRPAPCLLPCCTAGAGGTLRPPAEDAPAFCACATAFARLLLVSEPRGHLSEFPTSQSAFSLSRFLL